MATQFANFVGGTTTDNPLLVGATTMNSAGLANLPAVASPNIMYLVLDPESVDGAPEIVTVTAHTASATSATVTRGAQSTTAREHTSGTTWVTCVSAADLGHTLIGKTGLAKGDLLVATGNSATARQAVGSNGLPLVANSGQTNGIEYAALTATGLASSSVTTAKIADSNVTTAKIADANVTTAKIADGNVTAAKIQDARCQVARSGQSIASATPTSVAFTAEDFDPLTWHDNSSNNTRVTPSIAGWYRVTANAQFSGDTDYVGALVIVNKNGTAATPRASSNHGSTGFSGTALERSVASCLIEMNGTTDYFELQVTQTNTSAAANTVTASMLVELVRAS